MAKALASRLKLVMNNLFTEYQMAGAEGRLIQQNILIANELLDTKSKKREAGA